jgi:pimeloyl-ACP methyl ester carboxylesterase
MQRTTSSAAVVAVAAATALALSACSDAAPTSPVRTGADVEALSSPVWASQVLGETGPGSKYALYMPHRWNGDVVYYGHGIIVPGSPVALPVNDSIAQVRDSLGARGYAVAYSSFSETGWAVKDGAQRTHQLRGIFTSQYGKPARSYLAGHSMGGLIAQRLAEQFPDQYDGTLALCAPLAGGVAEINYLANVRVLFDHFYGGVLPGDALNVPDGLDLTADVRVPVTAAITASPFGMLAIASTRQTPLAGINGAEWATSLAYALSYNVVGTADMLDRTHGHSFFDNSATTYAPGAAPLLPPFLLTPMLAGANLNADRFTATPEAREYLERHYTPTGRLARPTVTLHTTRDPLVPFFHEGAFANAVSAAGASDLLVQRAVTGFGHCAFKVNDVMSAFDGLTGWAEGGAKPTP